MKLYNQGIPFLYNTFYRGGGGGSKEATPLDQEGNEVFENIREFLVHTEHPM